jgi:hypothetical protein
MISINGVEKYTRGVVYKICYYTTYLVKAIISSVLVFGSLSSAFKFETKKSILWDPSI